jgi:type III restriction enzyme
LTILDKGTAEIRDYIKLRQTRPFVVKEQGFLVPKKSLFNKIIGDSHLELLFASFLEKSDDVLSYAKNYLAVHFHLDYVNSDGNISNYYPDFIVKTNDKELFIAETKGIEDLDVPLKMARLGKWCKDVNASQKNIRFDFVFVDEEDFKKYNPDSFASLANNFRKYKNP